MRAMPLMQKFRRELLSSKKPTSNSGQKIADRELAEEGVIRAQVEIARIARITTMANVRTHGAHAVPGAANRKRAESGGVCFS